jgi:hypothetical protein
LPLFSIFSTGKIPERSTMAPNGQLMAHRPQLMHFLWVDLHEPSVVLLHRTDRTGILTGDGNVDDGVEWAHLHALAATDAPIFLMWAWPL